jgi:hypothetical protein
MYEDAAAAIQHANARVAELLEKVAREVADMSAQCDLTEEEDRRDLPLILYGIKQVSIDPHGFLRLRRQAQERETLHTARLYAAIEEGWGWAVSELLEITVELFQHEGWRQFADAEVDAVQARNTELAGIVERERLFWAFAHSYVCGTFASAYPDSLLRLFPTTACIHADVRAHDGEDTSEAVVAMQLALIDLLMLPNEAGWLELVDMN